MASMQAAAQSGLPRSPPPLLTPFLNELGCVLSPYSLPIKGTSGSATFVQGYALHPAAEPPFFLRPDLVPPAATMAQHTKREIIYNAAMQCEARRSPTSWQGDSFHESAMARLAANGLIVEPSVLLHVITKYEMAVAQLQRGLLEREAALRECDAMYTRK